MVEELYNIGISSFTGKDGEPVGRNQISKRRIRAKGTAAVLINTETKSSPQAPQHLWTTASEAADYWGHYKTLLWRYIVHPNKLA